MEKVKNSGMSKKEPINKDKKKNPTKRWQKPTLEDISEKIMAQPYIRFT